MARPSSLHGFGVSVSASVPAKRKVLAGDKPRDRPLRWPQAIPKRQRVKVDTGHRSFCLHRENFGQEALFRQPVHLTGYAFIMVAAGSVIFERGTERHVVEAGGYATLPPGALEITEVPVAGCTYGDVYYFFLTTSVLRDSLQNLRTAEYFALSMIPWPGEVGVTPRGLTDILEVMALGGSVFPHDFSKVLTVATNQMSAPTHTFYANHFFLPRLRVNFYMEQCVLDSTGVGDGYPGGLRHLVRDLRDYQGLNPEGWLRKRRIELAKVWASHSGVSPEDLVSKFEPESEAAGHCEAPQEACASWQELTPVERRTKSAPFWLTPRAIVAEDLFTPLEPRWEAGPAEFSKPEEGHCEQAEEDFWSATSTIGQVGNMIRAEFGIRSRAATVFGEWEERQAA